MTGSAARRPATARIEIDFVPGAAPIEGVVRDPEGSEFPFIGWLELLGTLGQVGERGRTTADGPHATRLNER